MKFREVFRFHFVYQLRRPSTGLYFVLLVVIAFLFVRDNFLADTLYADFFINSPFVIATVTVLCSLFWFLLATSAGGEAAARDVETGIHPLTYTAPVSKAEYLGGRFFAALILNSLILLAVPTGVLLAVYAYAPGVDAALVGPFRPAAYLTAYGYIALPNAFVGTAIHFASAALGRRSIASYVGSVVVFFLAYGGLIILGFFVGQRDLALLFDVFGHVFVTSGMITGWTPIEKSTRLIGLDGALLQSRLLWVGIALGTLVLTHYRFRFAHHSAGGRWSRLRHRLDAPAPSTAGIEVMRRPTVPRVRRTFSLPTYARQTLAIAGTSFGAIAKSRGGLPLLVVLAALAVGIIPQQMADMGTPLMPRTEYVLTFLTASLTTLMTPWVVIPLLIVLWAGELVWRERDAGLGEISDAAPVPEWAAILGRFLGLGLILVAWMAILTLAGVLIQVRMGYDEFEIGMYLQILLGLQLPEYLLFGLFALVIQGMVRQKYLGHLAALIGYALILFADRLGVEHHLLIYGSAPPWMYTEMRGFGASLGPWRWFMSYWAAWALLLAVVARVFWLRGADEGLRVRLRLAQRRFTRPTAMAAAATVGLILALGGFIYFNTNVLNAYSAAPEGGAQQAEYERRYGRYASVPQPRMTGTSLHIDIHPVHREVEVRGSYLLVNDTEVAIDTIHVATRPGVETGPATFDRPAARVVIDDARGHRIYALEEPLAPGDSLRLHFAVHVKPRGFSTSGTGLAVAANATFFRNQALLPAIGYQRDRELMGPSQRRAHGLPSRPLFPLLEDVEAVHDITGATAAAGAERIAFEAVVGTDADQIGVAPGALHRTWTDGKRRYFHYASDAPIGSEWSFFSARYAVREERWNPPADPGHDVAIRILYHPKHTANLDRMVRSVRASLDYYSREFGPYPYGHLTLVQNPGPGIGAHSAASVIDFTEGFTRFNPAADPRGLDLPFAVIAHEMAHQWWGAQLPYAYTEGAPLLIESAAWYSAMGVVEESYGPDHLRRLLRFFRQPQPIPPIRQSVPLLRAMDPYAAYRKGPFALYAMSQYIGRERVNLAFRRLLEGYRSGALPLPTSLDLYRELRAVTPDSLTYLLHDLFAANTLWELETERATATAVSDSEWQVVLRVRARKIKMDPAGVETELPMDDRVQIGVFAPTGSGADFGETLYLRTHHIRSGEQTITVTVPSEPSHAGIDPFHLLLELERFDNVEKVRVQR